jgi:hypothetical protein
MICELVHPDEGFLDLEICPTDGAVGPKKVLVCSRVQLAGEMVILAVRVTPGSFHRTIGSDNAKCLRAPDAIASSGSDRSLIGMLG